MKRLQGTLQLTKPLTTDIKDVKENMNKEFAKTAKDKKLTQITSFKVEGSKIKVIIEGEAFPSPHDAFLRLKKAVAEKLGREHKIGIKSINVSNYVLSFDLEREAKAPIKTQFAKSIKISGKKAEIEFSGLDEEALKNNYVDRVVKLVNEKIRDQYYEGREEAKTLIWESEQKKMFYDKDPSVEMEQINWIKRAPGKGQFVYGREFTALVETMKELLREEIYDRLGFYEMIFPKFEHWEIPRKSGHASYIYPIAYFVSVPKNSDPKYWEEVMDYYKVTGKIDKHKIVEKSEPVGMMSYAQCPPFWPYLEGRTVDEQSLPLKVYDWSGPTYRNESGGTHGVERVEEFNRIETLFVGTKQQVIKIWKEISESFKKFYSQTLDLEIKLYDVSPWWMVHAGKMEQGTKEVGTIDIDIYLPYRGHRDVEWLEVQNTSSIGNKYPKAFNVKAKKEEIWSGCCGASLQRIVLSFLAQKGFDTKNWPGKIRKKFESKVKGIKPLKFA